MAKKVHDRQVQAQAKVRCTREESVPTVWSSSGGISVISTCAVCVSETWPSRVRLLGVTKASW